MVLAGALLTAAEKMLESSIHPSVIAEAFRRAGKSSQLILDRMSIPISITDRATMIAIASTSLNSKVVAPYAHQMASIAVDAVLACSHAHNVDLGDIRVISRPGGTIEDTQILDGLALRQLGVRTANGPTRIEKARIALVQFQLSSPKPYTDNQIVVSDHAAMDRVLREERTYLLNMCKKIKKANANVLLVQKSILRDAVSDLALHYLAKLKIMIVVDIEREEIEFLSKTLGAKPIADIDSFTEDKLGVAELVEEQDIDGAQIVVVNGIRLPTPLASAATVSTGPAFGRKTVSVLCRGANAVIVEEAERSLHDALCVVRCLVRKPAMICGGGAPEVELSVRLAEEAKQIADGFTSKCFEAYAEAMESVPVILSESSGLDALAMLNSLKASHALGNKNDGVGVKRGQVADMQAEQVTQPLLVTMSAVQLATEFVSSILKIDDIVISR